MPLPRRAALTPRPMMAALAAIGLSLGVLSAVFALRGDDVTPAATASPGAIAPQVARDGFPPTSTPTPTVTPTPTPTPRPLAFKECYGPRTGDFTGFVMRPAAETSLFSNCQVIAYYGYPGVPSLGVLSQSEPAAMLQRLGGEVAAFDAANGGRKAVAAMEIIAAVAQDSPQADGSYLYRIPLDLLEEQIAFAEANDLLIVLDLQMGHSTVEAELPRLLPYLANSRVHLALDPEWAMPPGVVPGQQIGGMDASEINKAAAMLAEMRARERIPEDKILIVHQFVESMIRDKTALQPPAGIDLLIDMDGFGGQEVKIAHYTRFVGEDLAPHGGIKLFYRDDINLMTAAETNALIPQPDFVVYQ